MKVLHQRRVLIHDRFIRTDCVIANVDIVHQVSNSLLARLYRIKLLLQGQFMVRVRETISSGN